MATATDKLTIKTLENNFLEKYKTNLQMSGGATYHQFPTNSPFKGLISSMNSVTLFTQKDSLTVQSPACIAAPIVHMLTHEKITLGALDQRSDTPVKLYAPDLLTIRAREIIVGDIELLAEPICAAISCEKMTLVSFPEEKDPRYLEIF